MDSAAYTGRSILHDQENVTGLFFKRKILKFNPAVYTCEGWILLPQLLPVYSILFIYSIDKFL
jgi:hypothetical protein